MTQTTQRQWGTYTILHKTPYSKTKILCVHPNKRLSLQSHEHRSEHWCVIQGSGNVFNGETTKYITEGMHIYISIGQKHQLINTSEKENLLVIEVQYGKCDEEDITRYETP